MHKRKRITEIKNIGFISTRIAGTDGVSLETSKWAEVLEEMGYTCFYFAGELDTPEERSMLSPKAHFAHPEISSINEFVFKNITRPDEISDKIERIKRELTYDIQRFIRTFKLDLIIVENAFAIPLNIPLGVALTEFVAETGMPTVAHNHDFFWERKRFSVNCVWDYLNKAFPPRHPFIRQVVINSEARNEVAFRRGAAAIIIPNVMDFGKPPSPPDDYASDVRESLGIAENEYLILQPTRVGEHYQFVKIVCIYSTVIPAKAGIQNRQLGMTMEKQFYVYILANKRNGTLYLGVTSDLVKRVWQHKNGWAQGFTKKYGVKKLVYYEIYETAENAITREKQLKKWRRAWKLKLIEEQNSQWRDLYDDICQ